MKQLIPYLVIMILLKPLWPLVEYIIYYDYIVENLCENKDEPITTCNGKCYLAKQLVKESERNEPNPFNSELYKLKLPIVDWLYQLTITSPFFDFVVHNYKVHYELKTSLFTSKLIKPPEQA